MLVADTKLYDDLGGDGLPGCRGAYVAFGNTRPRARETVLGLAQRGEARQPLWSWARGSGYVPPKKGHARVPARQHRPGRAAGHRRRRGLDSRRLTDPPRQRKSSSLHKQTAIFERLVPPSSRVPALGIPGRMGFSNFFVMSFPKSIRCNGNLCFRWFKILLSFGTVVLEFS